MYEIFENMEKLVGDFDKKSTDFIQNYKKNNELNKVGKDLELISSLFHKSK